MSQALKHINWCLKKAEKELKEGKKHRGLIQINPDVNKATGYLNKAQHNFNAIDYFNEGNYSDWAVSAAFYTIYHCFLAILAKYGYESRNQECTISVIQQLKESGKLDLDDKFIIALKHERDLGGKQETVIEVREDLQYGVETETKESIVNRLKKLCSEIIDITKDEIYKENK